MQTTESCRLCEKITLTLESRQWLDILMELPNTFDPASRQYVWKHHGIMAYALIPQWIKGTTGGIDLYICIDEDDLDDLDLLSYATKFVHEEILRQWNSFTDVHLMPPALTAPVDIGCWKIRHEYQDGENFHRTY